MASLQWHYYLCTCSISQVGVTSYLACVCSFCDKPGSKGLSGMLCKVDYQGNNEDGIVESVDTANNRAVVYLRGQKEVVEVNTWDFNEVNGRSKRLLVTLVG